MLKDYNVKEMNCENIAKSYGMRIDQFYALPISCQRGMINNYWKQIARESQILSSKSVNDNITDSESVIIKKKILSIFKRK